jgi:erythromycin esterase
MRPSRSWINRHAVALPQTDAGGSVDDLQPLRRVVTNAQVVGLGESAHGTHEQFTLKHRAARFLTERMGFRTLAWEEN